MLFGALLVVGLSFTFGYCALTGEFRMLSEHITSIEDVKKLRSYFAKG